MLLAAYRDNAYNAVLFIHIASFLVAFAPAVINPLLDRYLEANGGDAAIRNFAGFAMTYTRISLGAMVVLFLTGIIMIIQSDEVIEFSDTWVSLSFLVWIAIAGVVSARILKGERLMASGDMSGRPMVVQGGQIASVLLLVMLYLMLFKPGA